MKRPIRIMQFIVLLAAMLCSQTVLATASNHESANCNWMQSRPVNSETDSEKQKFSFEISSKGETWELLPSDRHGPGDLYCQACAGGQPASGSYFFVGLQKFRSKLPEYYAGNSHQRVQRASEGLLVSGTLMAFSGLDLIVLAVRDDVSLQGYDGYSVFYKIRDSETLRRRYPGKNFDDSYLLVVHLTDGCVVFEAIFAMGTKPQRGIRLLDTVLSDLKILRNQMPSTKVHGSSDTD